MEFKFAQTLVKNLSHLQNNYWQNRKIKTKTNNSKPNHREKTIYWDCKNELLYISFIKKDLFFSVDLGPI